MTLTNKEKITNLAVLLVETFGKLIEREEWEDIVSNDNYVNACLEDKYGEDKMKEYSDLTHLEWSYAWREFDKALGVR